MRPAGIEPATYGLEGRCSIQLSYGRKTRNSTDKHGLFRVLVVNRGGRIRTCGILLPKQARYQAALRPGC